MTIGVSYMGTKQRLAAYVAKLASECRGGDFLDLFAGMCSVASAVGSPRQLWTNDLQVFSAEVATAKFCSQDRLIAPHDAAAMCLDSYQSNRETCENRNRERLRMEQLAIRRKSASALRDLLNDAVSFQHKRTNNHAYVLFSKYFGGTYFGVAQAIEIDSIRCAVDHQRMVGSISPDQHRWLLLALCVALGRCSTTTGHFAQPLAPKPENLNRFIIQRNRSIWQEWLSAIARLTPIGAQRWRRRNRVYRMDALDLLEGLSGAHTRPRPRVVYADPPYTKDQYSRYYHLYETAILYDYPGTDGKGQYRSDRAVSDFCLAANVDNAFARLIELCAKLKTDLIISYPSTGLLKDSRKRIPDLIKRHYRRKPDRLEVAHKHSTLGGSKGPAQSSVVEVFYRVSCNA